MNNLAIGIVAAAVGMACVFFLDRAFPFLPVNAQVASSTNFKIVSQTTISCGGGYSTSTNYRIFDTLCEQGTGHVSSTNFGIRPGLQAMNDMPRITATYSAGSVEFGDLSRSQVNTASMTATVSTNARSGYELTILADGHFRLTSANTTTTNPYEIIARVTDDAVTQQGDEYGFATSSVDLSIPTSTPRTVNSATTWKTETTTITFKAAPSLTNTAGLYTQTVTLIAFGTF